MQLVRCIGLVYREELELVLHEKGNEHGYFTGVFLTTPIPGDNCQRAIRANTTHSVWPRYSEIRVWITLPDL